MKMPIELVIEEERRKRKISEAESESPTLRLPLYNIPPQRRPEPQRSSIEIDMIEAEEENRGVTIISMFGDDF